MNLWYYVPTIIAQYLPGYNADVGPDLNLDTDSTSGLDAGADLETEKPIYIPASTDHKGIIVLYYQCDNKILYDKINELTKAVIPKISTQPTETEPIKELFRWVFGETKTNTKENLVKMNKIDNNIGIFEDLSRKIEMMTTIDHIRMTNPSLTYGPISEYNTCPELHTQILRRFKHNKGSIEVMRILMIVKWDFNLHLVNRWEADINETDLLLITKQRHKLELYMECMTLYKDCLTIGRMFREKHYNDLEETVVTNHIQNDFIDGLNDVLNGLIRYHRKYKQFLHILNCFERKRYYKFIETRCEFPPLNINVSCQNKSIHFSN